MNFVELLTKIAVYAGGAYTQISTRFLC